VQFVQFDQTFCGRRCWVHVYVLPFGVWGDECFAVIYNFPDLGLERLGGVLCCSLEIVGWYEVVDFGVVLFYG
jgi:hypothetical protein